MKHRTLLSVCSAALLLIPGLTTAQYTTLFSVPLELGRNPWGGIVCDGTSFYTTVGAGASGDCGSLFRVAMDGSDHTLYHQFDQVTTGCYPIGTLLLAGDMLYGTTSAGGEHSGGVIFSIHKDGSAFTVLKSLEVDDGCWPMGALITDGEWLYGTNSHCAPSPDNSYGALFKLRTDGSDYSVMFTFTDSLTGTNPYGALLLEDGWLYGTCSDLGTTYSRGAVFRIRPDGSSYSLLKHFHASGAEGSNPEGALYSDGTYLYGTTLLGGTNFGGTVFRLAKDGSSFTTLHHFVSLTEGHDLGGALISDGTYLWGYTNQTIFRIRPDGTDFSTAHVFNSLTEGGLPEDRLVLIDGVFYGTVQQGGTINRGAIFSFVPLTTGMADNAPARTALWGPNPFHDRLHVSGDTPLGRVELLDPLGRQVALYERGAATAAQLDLAHLPAGMYLLRTGAPGGTTVQRVVKQ